jgi:diacylglycerol kinase family enzyme
VIAAGGDGTINEVVDGMANSPVPMAILPAGTANVLANELGIASGLRQTAAQLAHFVPRRISLGRIRQSSGKQRHFLMMAGVGLDASIVYHLNLPLKARFGKLAYWLGGFSQVGRRLEEFSVCVDGRPHDCTFALISKVRNYGGDFEICRKVTLLDNEFEVVLFEGRNSFRYLKYLAGMMARGVEGMSGVSVYRAREISMAPSNGDRVFLHVDGELAGELPATVSMVPDALTLLIPPAYPGGGVKTPE